MDSLFSAAISATKACISESILSPTDFLIEGFSLAFGILLALFKLIFRFSLNEQDE